MSARKMLSLIRYGDWIHHRLGTTLQHPRLAKTIQSWAKTNGESFKTGWVAQDIATTIQQNGGIVTIEDMGTVDTQRKRRTGRGIYRGWKVYTMPPPSSGGLVILQVLSVLEGYDLTSMGQNSSDFAFVCRDFPACLCRQGELHG